MSIFSDQNFLTLLCYMGDLLVVAPNEEKALKSLEMVFEKLAPKKCYLLRRSVRFLGHIVDAHGVVTDPDKIVAIAAITEKDLMMGSHPPQKKSFLGMVVYYQCFISNCSSIAKPLFMLTAAAKEKTGCLKGGTVFRRIGPQNVSYPFKSLSQLSWIL